MYTYYLFNPKAILSRSKKFANVARSIGWTKFSLKNGFGQCLPLTDVAQSTVYNTLFMHILHATVIEIINFEK